MRTCSQFSRQGKAPEAGFLTSWLDIDGVAARLNWWSVLAGVDLVRLGTTADADEIRDTAKTQPFWSPPPFSRPNNSLRRRRRGRRTQRR